MALVLVVTIVRL